MTGSKRSEETKKIMSAWQKGMTYEEKYGAERSKELREKLSNSKKGKTLEEIYGDGAEAKRKACGWRLGIKHDRIECKICGKDVTKNTLKRHQSGRKCVKEDNKGNN